MTNISTYFKGFFFAVSAFLFVPFNLSSQTLEDYFLHFDKAIGQENLAVQNGPLNYRDNLLVAEGKSKYLLNQGFSKGNVAYQGQNYYEVNLRYDLFADLLLFNPQQAPPTIAAVLIESEVDSFSVLGKTFVNLNQLPDYKNSGINGYCQEIEIGKKAVLYIKHKKKQRQFLKNSQVVYNYDEEFRFLLNYDGNFHEITKIKDLEKSFPEKGKEIEKYADQFKDMENSDPVLFYQNLITHLTGLPKN